ncbi:MAG: hypothetical protein U0263_26830 [Polyangiaceae bacterium]
MTHPDSPRASRAGFFMQVVPALLYVFAVFYGGLIPAPHVPGPQISYSDKVLHALAFGFMHWVFYRALRFALPRRAFRFHNVAAFVCVTAAGGLLELLQLMTSYRSAEVLDFSQMRWVQRSPLGCSRGCRAQRRLAKSPGTGRIAA